MINNSHKIEKDEIEKLTDYVQQLCLKVKNEEEDITNVSLLTIVEQYLAYIILLQPESIDLDITAEFIVSISILILWKTNALLPRKQEENSEDSLENNCENLNEEFWKEYKKYQSLVGLFEEKATQQSEIYFPCLNAVTEIEEQYQGNYFPDLILAIESILSKKKIRNAIQLKKSDYNIDKKMKDIEEEFRKNKGELSFQKLVSRYYSKVEVIVIFLALLELICQGKIKYRQSENFGDIIFYRKEDIISKK